MFKQITPKQSNRTKRCKHPTIREEREAYRRCYGGPAVGVAAAEKRGPNFRVLAFANPNGSDGFSWLRLTQSVRRGSEQLWSKLGESAKKETGFDLEDANVKVGEFVGRAKEGVSKGQGELERFRTELVPEFVSWNRWERWKV
ncbi:hypothetical protein CMV_027302 [Castanea mollissima]|uniref:Uncharacterized protein n=1 Tax=Castanea mollissima TaxID=60419 RepID=A0A8J4QIB8_9ROSI|nr:hypothetical protein CMV_027302 [Castanea mollissima]